MPVNFVSELLMPKSFHALSIEKVRQLQSFRLLHPHNLPFVSLVKVQSETISASHLSSQNSHDDLLTGVMAVVCSNLQRFG